MGMRAGELRELIEIQTPVETHDEAGGLEITWETFATVHAKVEGRPGSEQFAALQVQDQVPWEVTIRHLEGVTAKMRIKRLDRDDALVDVISVVDPDGRKERLVMICAEHGE